MCVVWGLHRLSERGKNSQINEKYSSNRMFDGKISANLFLSGFLFRSHPEGNARLSKAKLSCPGSLARADACGWRHCKEKKERGIDDQ